MCGRSRKGFDILSIRVEPAQKRLLEKVAQAAGQSVMSFVLENAIQAAHRELDEMRTYSCSRQDAINFIEALERPPQSNAALRSAFEDYSFKYLKS